MSHFTAIREKLDYDPKTGAIAVEPREGKIGLDAARALILEIRDAGGAPLSDTHRTLEDLTGVVERRVEAEWSRADTYGGSADDEQFSVELVVWEGGRKLRVLNREQAEWLARRLGVRPPD